MSEDLVDEDRGDEGPVATDDVGTDDEGTDEVAALAEEVGGTFLFEGLEPERVRWLAERGDVVLVPSGSTLYREGEAATASTSCSTGACA